MNASDEAVDSSTASLYAASLSGESCTHLFLAAYSSSPSLRHDFGYRPRRCWGLEAISIERVERSNNSRAEEDTLDLEGVKQSGDRFSQENVSKGILALSLCQ